MKFEWMAGMYFDFFYDIQSWNFLEEIKLYTCKILVPTFGKPLCNYPPMQKKYTHTKKQQQPNSQGTCVCEWCKWSSSSNTHEYQ